MFARTAARRNRRWQDWAAWAQRHRRASRVLILYLRLVTAMFLLLTLARIGLWVTGVPDAGVMTAFAFGVTLVGLWTTWVWSRLDRGDPPSSLFR